MDIQLPVMFHGKIKNRSSLTQSDVYLFSQTQYRGPQLDMVRAPRFHSLRASCRTFAR
jgi:hypothetical protein